MRAQKRKDAAHELASVGTIALRCPAGESAGGIVALLNAGRTA